jgi:hypothetical protein
MQQRMWIDSGVPCSVIFPYVCADVHFLHSGEMKMRFLHIAPFHYRKYILKNFGCLEFSIRLGMCNIQKAHIFPA